MVAQHLAIEHPDRVLSMTSLSSTSGTRRYLPTRKAMKALFMPRPRDADQAVELMVQMFHVIGSPGFPRDEARLRVLARRAVDRGLAPRGFLRHFAAIMASGDRQKRLRRVTTPSLVIHGVDDPLIRVGAGRSTARSIPNAWWLPIDGMGHDLPKPIWPRLVDAVVLRAKTA
jgi:pimeloyl-ACP methyl ester carboxylesterase